MYTTIERVCITRSTLASPKHHGIILRKPIEAIRPDRLDRQFINLKPSTLSRPRPTLLRFTLTLLLPTTEHAGDIAPSPGSSVIDPTSRRLGRVAYCTDVRARIVFASPFSTVDAFLRHGVADPLERTTLAKLVADRVVQIALQLIDGFDPRHFGLIERIWLLVS